MLAIGHQFESEGLESLQADSINMPKNVSHSLFGEKEKRDHPQDYVRSLCDSFIRDCIEQNSERRTSASEGRLRRPRYPSSPSLKDEV
jgi:hypothetical protein